MNDTLALPNQEGGWLKVSQGNGPMRQAKNLRGPPLSSSDAIGVNIQPTA